MSDRSQEFQSDESLDHRIQKTKDNKLYLKGRRKSQYRGVNFI
jgi:hypothetical protein